jgi:hypothetical protein
MGEVGEQVSGARGQKIAFSYQPVALKELGKSG